MRGGLPNSGLSGIPFARGPGIEIAQIFAKKETRKIFLHINGTCYRQLVSLVGRRPVVRVGGEWLSESTSAMGTTH